MQKTGHVTCFPPLKACFLGNRPLEAENSLGNDSMHFPMIKCREKNKMDNAQNGYCSVEMTGKIKKSRFTLYSHGKKYPPP